MKTTQRSFGLSAQIVQMHEILEGLMREQAEQMAFLLLRATDIELSAIYHKRRSYALGASLEVEFGA